MTGALSLLMALLFCVIFIIAASMVADIYRDEIVKNAQSQKKKETLTKGAKRIAAPISRQLIKLIHLQPITHNRIKRDLDRAEMDERVANARKDWLHKRSRELADKWDIICVEDINLRGLAGTLKFGKSTNDNGFGMFRTFLGYKLAEQGKVLIKIDKWFPSSKMCHVCGAVNSELTLADREWTCECGEHHDRDINAAINIRNVGLAQIA